MFSSSRGNRESAKSFSGTRMAKSLDSSTGGKAGTSSGAAKAPVRRRKPAARASLSGRTAFL